MILGQKVLKGREKECAETTAVGAQILEMSAIEQRCQKTLGQVTCVVGIGTASSDVGVKRIPVRFTERGERRATSGGVLASGSRNETPSRGFKHEEILLLLKREVGSRNNRRMR